MNDSSALKNSDSSDEAPNSSDAPQQAGPEPLILSKKVSTKERTEKLETNPVKKRLWLALFLSVFPGLGHFYLGSARNGMVASLAMMVVFLSGFLYFYFGVDLYNGIIIAYAVFGVVGLWLIVYVLTFLDVFRLRFRGISSQQSVSPVFWSVFVVSTLVTFLIYLYTPNVYIARASDNSMLPIAGEGDYYLYSLDTSPPTKGEVVILRNPVPNVGGQFKSLRVIALEREQIKVENEVVYVDGKPLLRVRKTENARLDTPDGVGSVFLERYNAGAELIQYDVLELTNIAPFDSTRTYFVPPGSFFVMGDNRDASLDSRMSQDFGFPSVESVVGRPIIVIHSQSSDRFGKLF